MSSEMTLFADKSAQLPAHIVNREASVNTTNLAGSGGAKRISIKGRVFRLMVGNQEIAVNEESSMKLVIVASAPTWARTYYKGKYKENDSAPPLCWSDDGVKPNENAIAPQASACASCKQNIKGSGEDNSRACRYSARVAVALESDLEGGVYGMGIPATSVFGQGTKTHFSLQEYARKLQAHNVAIEQVVTEVKFDVNAPVPKLLFRAFRPLTDEEFEQVKALTDHPDMATHIGPRTFEEREDEEQGTPADSAVEEAEEDADEPETVELEEESIEDEAPAPKVAKSKKKEAPPAKPVIDDILDEWGQEE